MNNDEIKIKSSKAGLVIGIILTMIWMLIETVLISEFVDEEMEFFELILSSIFPSILLGLMGVLMIIGSIKDGRRMRDILARYGEANIINHIHQNTIGVFQKNQYTDKVYFTNSFVVEPTTAIIHYSEISWMYKHITRHKNTSTVSIAFALLDGNKFFLCDHADDNDIANIMRTCQQYNPNIIFGYSKETEAQHEMNVKRFKSGLGQIAHAPIASGEMQRSNNYENGKKQLFSGIFTLVCGAIGAFLAAFVLDDAMGDTGAIAILVVMIPVVIAGVCVGVSGWEKMQSSKDR